MPSTACWSWDARVMSASLDPERDRGCCAHVPDPCTTAAPRTTPGGQPSYSDLAITTALMLRAVFRLALRQTEGLIGSILHLLGLELAVPDHSTLSRRAETLEVPRPCSSSR